MVIRLRKLNILILSERNEILVKLDLNDLNERLDLNDLKVFKVSNERLDLSEILEKHELLELELIRQLLVVMI
jgi:hypothetical protein